LAGKKIAAKLKKHLHFAISLYKESRISHAGAICLVTAIFLLKSTFFKLTSCTDGRKISPKPKYGYKAFHAWRRYISPVSYVLPKKVANPSKEKTGS
jgi:hypothetical protein